MSRAVDWSRTAPRAHVIGLTRAVGVLATSAVFGSIACAAPTGLVNIPTADLVPPRQYSFSLQNGNTSTTDDPTLLHQPQPLLQWQFGLNPHFEAGVDLLPSQGASDYRPQLNLKWKALDEDYARPAVAVGIAQVGSGFGAPPTYYGVLSRTLNYSKVQYQRFRAHHRNIKQRGRRLHGGVVRTPQGTFPLVGTDLEMSDHFVFYSDWISGSPNAASCGGAYIVNPTTSVTAALLYGNHQHRINGLVVNYSRTLKW